MGRSCGCVVFPHPGDHNSEQALVEVFTVGGRGRNGDERAWRALEDLARELDVDAVVHAGPVDVGRVHRIADRIRLMVIAVDAVDAVTTPEAGASPRSRPGRGEG